MTAHGPQHMCPRDTIGACYDGGLAVVGSVVYGNSSVNPIIGDLKLFVFQILGGIASMRKIFRSQMFDEIHVSFPFCLGSVGHGDPNMIPMSVTALCLCFEQ